MGLGEKARKFFLKLGFRYLPWIAFGTLAASIFIDLKDEHARERVLMSSNIDSLKISPDAKRIAFSTNQFNERNDADVYVSGMNGENIEHVIDSPDNDHFTKWSPDGNSFLFERKNALCLFDLVKRKEQMVYEGPAYYADFSPDGRAITFYRDGTLHFFDRDSLETHKVPEAKTDSFIPHIRWNNRTALFKHGDRLAFFSLDNPQLEEIVSEPISSFDWAGKKIAYIAQNNKSILQVIDRDSRKTSQIRLAVPGQGILGTDGFVAIVSPDNKVFVADCADGSVSKVGAWQYTFCGAWNNSLLAINPWLMEMARGRKRSEGIYVYDAVAKRLSRITGGSYDLFYRWLPDNRMLVASAGESKIFPNILNTRIFSVNGDYELLTHNERDYDARFLNFYYRGLAAFGILGFLGLLGAYGISRARRRQCVIEPHRGFDKIFDYPAALSGGITAASLAGLLAYAQNSDYAPVLPHIANKSPLLVTAGLGTVGAIVWSVFYNLAHATSRLKSPCLLNYFLMACRAVYQLWNPRKALNNALESVAVEDDSTLSGRAVLAAYENRPLDAVFYHAVLLRFKKRRPELEEAVSMDWVSGFTRRIINRGNLIANSVRLRRSPDDLALLTRRQFLYLERQNERKARQIAEKILSLPGCTDEDRILQSFVLESLGEPERADRLRKEAFPGLFKESQRARIENSILYQKFGLKERLVKESQILDYLQRFCSTYDFDVARPLGVWDFGRMSFLFETFSDGESLYDYLEQNPDIGVMRKAAMAQAALHALLPSDNNYDLEKDVLSFMEKLPQHIRKQRLYDALIELLTPVVPYQSADCDGHRENRHYNISQQITVYDAESRGSSPQAYDYAKLRGQGCSVGSFEQQKDLLVESAGVYNRIVQPERRVPESEFYNHVLRASPYKAMRFALFVKGRHERHHSARQFIANAELDLHVLSEVLKKESRYALCDALCSINDVLT